METGFLNFHDAEHFSDFALSLDQHDLLDDSQSSLMAIDSDFDYMHSQLDTSSGLWGTEQELNGDLAVLPVSGVASFIPKIENIKEDYAKVLTDWQEHIGYLQASDMEEDIDMVALSINMPEKLNTGFPDDIFQEDITHTSVKNTPKFVSTEMSLTNMNDDTNVQIPKFSTSLVKMEVKLEPEQLDEKIENEDCVDVETIPEHEPVLEAGDVKSLLEQFEASEAGVAHPIVNVETKAPTKNAKKANTNKVRACTDQSKQTLLKKSVESEASKHHKNIRDCLPKEVIDRITASSSRKKVISVIPALSNPKNGSRSSGTKIQEPVATVSRNKPSKIVTNCTSSRSRMDGSVQLDHDYCSSASSIVTNSDSSNDCEKLIRHKKPTSAKNHGTKRHNSSVSKVKEQAPLAIRKDILKRTDSWVDSNSKKDSGLESGDVSDSSEEPTVSMSADVLVSARDQRIAQTTPKQSSHNASPSVNNTNVSNASNKAPVCEMKIRSALATSILQLRNGVLTKTKSVDGNILKGKQMISVLKKPPMTSAIVPSNPNESIVTTKNSSNDEVQNIIVKDTSALTNEIEKKPPRRKLNLAEYRSRRDQGRSDNSRTCSPIQPMALVYIHHASTTTEPIKDDPENPVWSEREIVSVLKPKSEVEEEKHRAKPATSEIAIQTYETVFNNPARTDEPEPEVETRVCRSHDRKQRSYRQRRVSSSSSRSRSRSRSRSSSRSRSRKRSRRSRSVSRRRSRTRSRSSRSRSRSRSRSLSRRRNARQRRISHRRSSVSSSSSWSSRSRSRTTYSRSRSRSSSSRSRSRSSRSRSSSRYSSSRSSRSNVERNRHSRYRRPGKRERRTSGNKHRRGSSGSSYRNYTDWRRSPSYRRPYDTWYNQEKKRQVEERRVIYVGRLEEGITKVDLRRRFEAFGPVLDISLHFREHGDNYGFVTFGYKNDAYEAVEHGNDDPSLPRYDLCFGGRRAFCKVKYADLDGMASNSLGGGRSFSKSNEDNTFDLLLKEAKAKLRNRKV